MRLVSFERRGRASFGIVVGEGVIDAGARLGREFVGLREVLAAGAVNLLRGLEGLAPDLALEDIDFLPAIPDPAARIICVNAERPPQMEEDRTSPRSSELMLFTPFAGRLLGHGRPIPVPTASECCDLEGRLAVIIGKRACAVDRAEALHHVAGLSVFIGARARNGHPRALQQGAGTRFHRVAALGPWIVTVDGEPVPTRFRLHARLDGGMTECPDPNPLRFDIAAQIAYCSAGTPLEPGDVLVTSASGAGRGPTLRASPGDTVSVGIDGIGVLSNPIVAEEDAK